VGECVLNGTPPPPSSSSSDRKLILIYFPSFELKAAKKGVAFRAQQSELSREGEKEREENCVRPGNNPLSLNEMRSH
jgi:hypothetical protein